MYAQRGTPEDGEQQARIPRGLSDLRAAVRAISTEEHGLKLTGLRSHGPSDLAAVLRDSCDSNHTLVHATQALADQPDVAVAQRAGRRVLLRVEDEPLAAMGAALEDGVAELEPTEDSAFAGHRYMIQFLDPNATKALHLGHLRNVALGQAYRCALLSAGADAWSRTALGDAGQQIGEAMAGCMEYGDGRVNRAPGVKGDHVVGAWYARYVAEHRIAGDEDAVADVDRHLAREVAVRDDLATQLLARWEAEDPEVRALWRELRDWAVIGQNQTLARLGVRFDVEISEADTFPRIAAFVAEGLARGAMRYAADTGALVYETGDDDYPIFPLARPDGFPTQNLRTLALWYELMPAIGEAQSINVVGEEWRAHTLYVQQILERMGMGVPVQPTHDIVHGMISAGDGDMSSSDGDVVLIDDLLDTLAASPQLRALAVRGRPGCEAEDLGVMAALAFCLNRPLSKGMEMSAERMLDPQTSAGMLLARAWSKAWSPTSDGAAAPAPEDPAYRFAVMYCQFQADVLAQGLSQLDLLGVVRSVTRMAKWYVGTPSSPSVDRVMRSLLTRGLRALGVQSAPVAFEAGAQVAPRLMAAAQR